MVDGASPIARLQRYLQQLSPAAQDRLLAEFERAALRGEELPGGGTLVLDQLRALRRRPPPAQVIRPEAWQAARGADAPRSGRGAEASPVASRLFFRPLDPFLVDDAGGARVHISRAGLEPMWRWVCHELMPAEAESYVAAVAAQAGDEAACEQALTAFHDAFVLRAGALVAAAGEDDRLARRLSSHCGLARGLAGLGDIVLLIRERATLAAFSLGLPAHIANLGDEPFNRLRRLFERLAPIRGPLHPFLITLAMGRLAAPWQIVRLASAVADEPTPEQIARTVYADTLDVVLDDLERQAGLLKHDVASVARRNALGRLRYIHDGLRGLRSELELPLDGPQGGRLARIRREAGAAIRPDLEQAGPRLRRLLKLPDAAASRADAAPDPDEIAEVETLIALAEAAHHYGSELAVSELAARAWAEVAQCLDSQTRALIEVLRVADDEARTIRRARVDMAARLNAIVYGPEHTAVLRKAADVAEAQSRKGPPAKSA